MPYPLIVNSGLKGPPVAALAARTTGPAAFLDDLLAQPRIRGALGAGGSPLPDGGRRPAAPPRLLRARTAYAHRRLACDGPSGRRGAGAGVSMIRIGVDFGGTKIEAAALSDTGAYLARVREPNPGEYHAAIAGRRPAGGRGRKTGRRRPDQGRPRHARLHLPQDRPRAQFQQRLAERHALRQGMSRRRSAGRCGSRTTPTVSPSPKPPTARAKASAWCSARSWAPAAAAAWSSADERWRGATASAANGVTAPCPGPRRRSADAPPLLVRTRQLPGNLDLRNRLRRRLPRRHRQTAEGLRHHDPGPGRRRRGAKGPRPLHRPPGAAPSP